MRGSDIVQHNLLAKKTILFLMKETNNHPDSTYIMHYRLVRFIIWFFSFNLFGSISGFLQDVDAIKRM